MNTSSPQSLRNDTLDILQVIASFPPVKNKGGPPNVALQRTRHLAELGHNVTVYTTDRYDENERYDSQETVQLPDGVSVRRFRNLSHKLATSGIPIPIRMANRLYNSIDSFDIVHLHGFRTLDAIFVRWFAELNNIPYVIKPGGSVPRIGKEAFKMVFDIIEGKKILRDATTIQAVSTIESDRYQDIFPELNMNKVRHLPNGIDISKFKPDAVHKGEFRHMLNLNDERIILFLGRLNEIKRPQMLLTAFEEIVGEVPDTKLVFVGPDEGERSSLEQAAATAGISEDVIFTGPLYGTDKLEAFVDADVFVLPSRYDAFPVTTLEAMACRLPVVLSQSVGVVEHLNGNCRTFETQVELQEHLRELILNTPARDHLAEAGYQYVRQHFDWKEVARRIVSMYEQAIERHKS